MDYANRSSPIGLVHLDSDSDHQTKNWSPSLYCPFASPSPDQRTIISVGIRIGVSGIETSQRRTAPGGSSRSPAIPIPPWAMFMVTPWSINVDGSGALNSEETTATTSTTHGNLGAFRFSFPICTLTGVSKSIHCYECLRQGQSFKWVSRPTQGSVVPPPQSLVVYVFPTMPERVETPILTMIIRRNAFTVWGLISIPVAISLVVRPTTRCRKTCCSRVVR